MAYSHNGNGSAEDPYESDPIPEFSRDLTSSEAELGFALVVVPSLQGFDPLRALSKEDYSYVPVVAVILSSYEILVKLNVGVGKWSKTMYSHREYGYARKFEKSDDAKFYPIGEPIRDAAIYLAQYKAGIVEIPQARPAEIFEKGSVPIQAHLSRGYYVAKATAIKAKMVTQATITHHRIKINARPHRRWARPYWLCASDLAAWHAIRAGLCLRRNPCGNSFMGRPISSPFILAFFLGNSRLFCRHSVKREFHL